MTIKTVQFFNNYSQEALEKVIRTSIGKPFRDNKWHLIGEISSATIVSSNTIEFEIKLEVI